MGCGGSKQDVATGNTVATTRRTLNSEAGKTETTTTSPSTAVVDPAESAGSTKAVSTEEEAEEDVNKDAVEPSSPSSPCSPPPPSPPPVPAVEVKTEEGKTVVSKESSPDRYFSPTKEEALAAKRRMGSDGAYYSPRGDPETSAKVEGEAGGDAPAAASPEEAVVVKAGEGGVAEGGEDIAPTEKGEELKSKDPADLKEDVLVEKKKSEATIVESKNVGEGEKGNNSSTH